MGAVNAGGISVIAEGISALIQCVEDVIEVACEPCCTCCGGPEAQPEPEPCPEPEPEACPEPEPEPCPEPGPPIGEGTIAPPPELAEVKEPPAPAEKMAASTQASGSVPAPASSPVADSAFVSEESPAEALPDPLPSDIPVPAAPGDGPAIKKTGGW